MSLENTTSKKRTLKYEKNLVRPTDPNKPKRPLSAYFKWANENRDRVQKEMASAKLSEVTKALGDMWRELPDEEKESRNEEYRKEMDVYKEKNAAYKQTSESLEYDKSLREYQIKMTWKPFKKDDNRPKRAPSAYMLFAADERPLVIENNPDMKLSQVMVLIGQAWKALSDSKKKPYETKAKKLAKEVAQEIEKYEATPEHSRYMFEKRTYLDRMAAKRNRLIKLAIGMEIGPKGSGASPMSKRKKSSAKKKTTPKKKSSKKKVSRKKKTSAKKGSAKKASTGKKKKVSKPRKRSAKRKAVKAKSSNNSSKK